MNFKAKIKSDFPRLWWQLKRVQSWLYVWRYLKRDLGRGRFLFEGKRLWYFSHRHNISNFTERTIEVPILLKVLRKYSRQRILEIGNVLSWYVPAPWDIVDKYEKGHRVINQDIVAFEASHKYDFVFSISTFEHIGYDEEEKDKNKVLRAVAHVQNNLLAPGGLFVMTIPFGYNRDLDAQLFNGELRFEKIYYFQRISEDNRWQMCAQKDVLNAQYGSPFMCANALAICATKDLSGFFGGNGFKKERQG